MRCRIELTVLLAAAATAFGAVALAFGAVVCGCAPAGPRPEATVFLAPPDRAAPATRPDRGGAIDWGPYARVLGDHVADSGRVDYFAIAHAEPLAGLRAVYADIARIGPASRPELFAARDHKLAYYLNAHNLLAVLAIAPLFGPKTLDPRSVADLPAPLETGYVFVLDGRRVTLESIRRELVGPLLDGDPRPLLALCTGRRNDPPLRRQVYAADTLDAQLADQLVRVLREPPWCEISFADRRIELPAGVADHRDYYWSRYLALGNRQRRDIGFATVLLEFADARGRLWLNRGLSYPVVRANPSGKFNNKPLFLSWPD